MLYLCVDVKPHRCISAGNVRMGKAVQHALILVRVPIIQIKVVEQCPDDQIFLVYTDVQLFCHGTADMHHRKAVL